MTAGPAIHVVFAGGATGGHLYPGLAVAEWLVADSPRTRITFAGGGKPWERRVVAAAGFDYVPLRCRAFSRRIGEVVPFLLDNFAGYRAALRFLRWHRVSVVVGLGGYASVPMARAAVRARVPLLLLEQNTIPGRATRWLAPSAAMVCLAFEEAVEHLGRKCAVRVTGNPVREGFMCRRAGCPGSSAASPQFVTAGGSLRPTTSHPDRGSETAVKPHKQLLVLGGSFGAHRLNQNVPRAISRLGGRLAGWKVVHQSGQSEFEATRRAYAAAGLLGRQADVRSFLPDLPQVLSQSDLAVCRAGGTTLAELAAAGVPAVLLPYPFAADDHQRKNADAFAAGGGTLTLDERELGNELDRRLSGVLAKLLADDARRTKMSQAIRRRAQPDATWDVATMIRHLVV